MAGDPLFGEFTSQAPRDWLSRRARAAWRTRRARAAQLVLPLMLPRPSLELNAARRSLLALLQARPPRPDTYGERWQVAPGHWNSARLVCERHEGRLRLRFEGDPHHPPLFVAGPRTRREGARYFADELWLVQVQGRAPYWRASGVIEVQQ